MTDNLDKSFLVVLEAFVNYCVDIVKNRNKAQTKAGKRLKSYNASLKVLKGDLEKSETDRIRSSIKSFRALLGRLDPIIQSISEGDHDDSWLWLKYAPRRITYIKNGEEVKKISLHISVIYKFCHRVKERYEFMIKLFAIFRTVATDKEIIKRLKKIIDDYTNKLRQIPEEEDMVESSSEKESEGEQKDLTKIVKSSLGAFGITPDTVSKIASGDWDPTAGAEGEGSQEDDADESDDKVEVVRKAPKPSKEKQ